MDHPAKFLNQLKAGIYSKGRDPRLLDAIPQEAGPRRITFRGGAVHCVRPPHSEVLRPTSHLVSVTLAPTRDMEAGYGGGRLQKFDALRGMIEINPANLESTWHSPDAANYVHIALPPQTLLELAEQELDRGSIDLQPIPFGTVDRKALYLAQMLKAELSEREAANELYVDSLITLFGIHLLRTYASSGKALKVKGGLPPHKARRVRDYLQENLSRKVSVVDLATLCELSPGRFIKAFSTSFGQSPHQYLLHLRLSAAELMLVGSDLAITEVAHLSGFSSQSHLTATMRRYKNTTPAQIRASR